MSHVINKKWDTQISDFNLESNQIHIWSVRLNIDTQTQIRYWRILSEEERDRANRFKFVEDKIKYIACRGVLRHLLGLYLGEEAEHVKIGYIKNGKPHHRSNLEFNASHSQDWAVIGFTLDTVLGIDIEYVNRNIEFEEIAQRFFSPEESTIVNSAQKDLIPRYFYNCWTRKEAFIKALGDGLSFPLDRFVVSCAPEDIPQLRSTKWDKNEVNNWCLWGFEKGNDYVGAIAIRGGQKQLSYFTWDHNQIIQ